MTEIIPAIMPREWDELRTDAGLVRDYVNAVQVDIMDGVFVPDATWPYCNGHDESFRALIEQEEGYPYWQDLDYEVDLMVQDPESVVSQWIESGAQRVIAHYASTEHIEELLRHVQTSAVGDGAFRLNVEFGLAIQPTDDISILDPYTDSIDFIQCMGIDRIGFQGQPFNEQTIVQISNLRKRFPGAILSVDGGVDFDTAPKLIAAGADRLVSGSAIFESDNIQQAIETLRNETGQ
jgi:ribulose-phosphate 3-epimerase